MIKLLRSKLEFKGIDQLVYKLYGLTLKEIEIVDAVKA